MPDPFLVLLDRDGTINIDRHYLADPEGLEFLPGAVEGLQTLRDAGAVFSIVTNQSGVGRGLFDRAAAEAVNARLVEMLGDQGVKIAHVGLCPHAPEDACDCRKPAPKLALEAAAATGLPLDQAWVIGDKASDTGLAEAVGARGVLIAPGSARDLVEAARIILTARTGQGPV